MSLFTHPALAIAALCFISPCCSPSEADLRSDSLQVSGFLRDDAGNRVANASIRICGEGEYEIEEIFAEGLSCADGSFSFALRRGLPENLYLEVESMGYWAVRRILEFNKSHSIRLDRTASHRVSYELPRGVRPEQVRAKLVVSPENRDLLTATLLRDSLAVGGNELIAWPIEVEQGSLAFSPVPGGLGTLVISSRWTKEVLWRSESTSVGPGAPINLSFVDLRMKVQVFRVSVEDETGADVRRADLFVQSHKGMWRRAPIQASGELALMSAGGLRRALVVASGFWVAERESENLGGTVRLQRGSVVRVARAVSPRLDASLVEAELLKTGNEFPSWAHEVKTKTFHDEEVLLNVMFPGKYSVKRFTVDADDRRRVLVDQTHVNVGSGCEVHDAVFR